MTGGLTGRSGVKKREQLAGNKKKVSKPFSLTCVPPKGTHTSYKLRASKGPRGTKKGANAADKLG